MGWALRGESGAAAREDGYRVGVDIGGTFTDVTVADAHRVVALGKVLTTARHPAGGVVEAVAQTLARSGIAPGLVREVVHGTTLVTNALIERKGPLLALLATAGFRDVLELGRERRYELYDLLIEAATPLVPRHLRFDVPERTLATGVVVEPVDVDYLERLSAELWRAGVTAVAVAFLHSYVNPANERSAAEAIRSGAPDMTITLSSDVVPEIREYERMTTTVASSYVEQRVAEYLMDVEERLGAIGTRAPLHVMLSDGGIATAATARRHPIRLLESGPAGGALAAAAVGAAGGRHDLLSFDMGGTTAKLCVVEGGRPAITQTFEVDRVYRLRPGSGIPIKTPVVDLIEIGVGGGSIARIDALGLLRVGPESAGSEPGPACYGRGGETPTVTDADLLLGYLNPEYFLGGEMALDVGCARRAVETHIAEPLGVSVEAAAWGIHRRVNEDMANAARVHAVERGYEASALPFYAFGGAGPVHGAGVVAGVGGRTLVIPAGAGVMSSVGFLNAPQAFEFVHSQHAELADLDEASVEGIFTELEAEGMRLLLEGGVDAGKVVNSRSADMRYVGQGFEVRVPLPGGRDHWVTRLREAFEERYARLYGRRGPLVPAEVLNWRLVSSGPKPEIEAGPIAPPNGSPRARRTRPAYFGRYVETAVYDRYGLTAADRIVGPAIVEERESTLVVPPRAMCVLDGDGSLVVTFDGGVGA